MFKHVPKHVLSRMPDKHVFEHVPGPVSRAQANVARCSDDLAAAHYLMAHAALMNKPQRTTNLGHVVPMI